MKVGTIKSSALTNCWNASQVSKCVGCAKYNDCTYPKRQNDPVYDELLKDRQHHLRRMRVLDRMLRYYESRRTLDGFDQE